MKKPLFWGLVLLPLFVLSACDLPPEEDGDGGSTDYSGYEALFSKKTLHEIEIVISQEEWDGHIQDMKDYAENDTMGFRQTGKYRKATLVSSWSCQETGSSRRSGSGQKAMPPPHNSPGHR